MESDSRNCEIKNKTKEDRTTSSSISNACDVFSAVWLRCAIQADNGFKWLVLDGRPGFLLGFRLLLVILYLTYSNLK